MQQSTLLYNIIIWDWWCRTSKFGSQTIEFLFSYHLVTVIEENWNFGCQLYLSCHLTLTHCPIRFYLLDCYEKRAITMCLFCSYNIALNPANNCIIELETWLGNIILSVKNSNGNFWPETFAPPNEFPWFWQLIII